MIVQEPPPAQTPSICCLGCGYDLQGLDQNRCPECGRAFDPGDPYTFTIERRPCRVLHVLRPAALVAATVLGVVAGAALSSQFPDHGRGSPTILIFVPLFVFLGTAILQGLLWMTTRELWAAGVAIQILIWGAVSYFTGYPPWDLGNGVWVGVADIFILAPVAFGIVIATAARGARPSARR